MLLYSGNEEEIIGNKFPFYLRYVKGIISNTFLFLINLIIQDSIYSASLIFCLGASEITVIGEVRIPDDIIIIFIMKGQVITSYSKGTPGQNYCLSNGVIIS